MSGNPEATQQFLKLVIQEGHPVGLGINRTKRKLMFVSRRNNLTPDITIYEQHVEAVNRFKYLGSYLISKLNTYSEV